jgi:hypothetical protein
MTITYNCFCGAESRDLRVDGHGNPPLSMRLSGWTAIPTPKKTGVAAWLTTAYQSPVGFGGFGGSNVVSLMFWVNCDGSPTSASALVRFFNTPSGTIEVEVGTDRKIRLVSTPTSGGWTSRTPLTDWSSNPLPNGSWGHLVIFLDGISGGMSHVWCSVLLDDDGDGSYTEEFSLDLGQGDATTPFYTIILPYNHSEPNFGISFRLDDIAILRSSSSGDRPHLTHWPIAEAHRQLAMDDVATDWQKQGSGAGTYASWDDPTGGDDDSTYNQAEVAGKYQCGGGMTAATIPITGHTVIEHYGETHAGPAINVVQIKADADDKFDGHYYNSKGDDPVAGSPSTTYLGYSAAFPKATAWEPSDADDLDFGCYLTPGGATNMMWRVTLCMMQWCTYTDTLPLTTEPTLPPTGGARAQVLVA